MKNKNYLRFISIFIAVLIVSMPIYISDAYAQTLSITQNSGQAGVQDGDDGFIDAYDDIWTLEVNAQNSGQTILPNQVRVNGFNFDSCTPGVSGYSCIYQFDYSGASTPETTYPLTIDLYDSTYQVVETETATVTADGSAPILPALDVKQDNDQVKITMDIQDEPADCAGIGKIEVYDVESDALLYTLKDQDLEDQITSQCGVNNIEFNVVFPSAGNLTKTGRIVAYDRLGNSRTKTDSFTFDYNKPVVITQFEPKERKY